MKFVTFLLCVLSVVYCAEVNILTFDKDKMIHCPVISEESIFYFDASKTFQSLLSRSNDISSNVNAIPTIDVLNPPEFVKILIIDQSIGENCFCLWLLFLYYRYKSLV